MELPLDKTYVCDVCRKTFSDASNRRVHMRTHTKEKPFACNICSKQFAASSTLKQHLWLHSDKKPYCCKKCGKDFCQISNFKLHLRTHVKQELKSSLGNIRKASNVDKEDVPFAEEKRFECPICCKKFTQRGNRDTHVRIHVNFKPFSCDICDKNFVQKIQLHNHLKTHRKSYPNPECGQNFRLKSEVILHEKTHDFADVAPRNKSPPPPPDKVRLQNTLKIYIPKIKIFSCDVCSEVFHRVDYFAKHKQSHDSSLATHTSAVSNLKPLGRPCENKKPFSCNFCDRKFCYEVNRNLHARRFICNECRAVFCNEAELLAHKSQHKLDDILPMLEGLCEVCGKNFAGKKEFNAHLLRFHCDMCGEDFCDRQNFRVHFEFHKTAPSVPERTELPCQVCGEHFIEQRDFDSHFLKFQCKTCGEHFCQGKNFIEHFKSHETDDADSARRSFLSFMALQRDPRVRNSRGRDESNSENEQKMFECSVCWAKFATNEDVKAHMQTHAGNSDRFSCNLCGKTFELKWRCDSHMMTHLRGSLSCKICGKKFEKVANFVRHAMTHNTKASTSEAEPASPPSGLLSTSDPLLSNIEGHSFSQKDFLRLFSLRVAT